MSTVELCIYERSSLSKFELQVAIYATNSFLLLWYDMYYHTCMACMLASDLKVISITFALWKVKHVNWWFANVCTIREVTCNSRVSLTKIISICWHLDPPINDLQLDVMETVRKAWYMATSTCPFHAKLWYSISNGIKTRLVENISEFKTLLKKWNGSPCICKNCIICTISYM